MKNYDKTGDYMRKSKKDKKDEKDEDIQLEKEIDQESLHVVFKTVWQDMKGFGGKMKYLFADIAFEEVNWKI